MVRRTNNALFGADFVKWRTTPRLDIQYPYVTRVTRVETAGETTVLALLLHHISQAKTHIHNPHLKESIRRLWNPTFKPSPKRLPRTPPDIYCPRVCALPGAQTKNRPPRYGKGRFFGNQYLFVEQERVGYFLSPSAGFFSRITSGCVGDSEAVGSLTFGPLTRSTVTSPSPR